MKKTVPPVLILVLAALPVWAAFAPSENPSEIRWVSASSESWSGSAQSRSNGILLHLVGTFDTSVDTINGAGVTGFLGLLDPISGQVSATSTPTCIADVDAAVFNLDGINGIDARDLLLLYAALKDDGSTLFDLDCSGVTDIFDLIQFSQHWQNEIP